MPICALLLLLLSGSASPEETWSAPRQPHALLVLKGGAGRHESRAVPLPATTGREVILQAPAGTVTAVVADAGGCGVAEPPAWGAQEVSLRLRPWRALEGRVVTPSGQPLPGATVHWTPMHEAGDALRLAAEARALLGPLEVVTDADGRFRVPAAWSGAWSLQARAPTWLPSNAVIVPAVPPPASPTAAAAAAGSEAGSAASASASPVVIRMPAGWSPRGRVVERDGDVERPVAGARVTAEVEGVLPPPATSTLSDDAGAFALHGFPPGRAVLRVSAEGFASRTLHVSAGDPASVVLERLGGISFRLPEGMKPGIVAAERLAREGGQWIPHGEPVEAVPQDGMHVVGGIEPGQRALRVLSPCCLPFVTDPAVVRAGRITDIGELALMPGAVLRGRVIDAATGEGVAGARVERRGETDYGVPMTRTFTVVMDPSATTGPDGAFELTGLRPGEWEIDASADGFPRASSHRMRVSIPEDPRAEIAPVTFRLLKAGELRVLVEDARGMGVPGVRLVLSERGGGWAWSGDTGPDGTVLVNEVAPGPIGVSRRDGRAATEPLTHVHVPSGGRAEITVRETGTLLRGRVRAEGRGIPGRVSLGRFRGSGGFAESYELRDVPAGVQEVTVAWPLVREDGTFSHSRFASEIRTVTIAEGLFEMIHDFDVPLRQEPPDEPPDGGRVRVEGRLIDSSTGEPLSGAIRVAGPASPATFVSDEDGRFGIELRDGNWSLVPTLPSADGWQADVAGTVSVRGSVVTTMPDPLVLSARRSRQAHLLLAQGVGERLIPLAGADCALLAPPFAEASGQVSGRFGMTHSADALGRLALPVEGDEPADALCLAHGLGLAFVPRVEPVAEDAPRVVMLGPGATLSWPREAPGSGWMLAETQTGRGWRLPLDDSSLLRSLRSTRDERVLLHGLPAGSWRLVDAAGRGRSLTLEVGSVTAVDLD